MAIVRHGPGEENPPKGKTGATFGQAKRWASRVSLVVGGLLISYIFLLGNIVAFRHPLRLDLTEERMHRLTQRTRDTLARVREPIHIVIPVFNQQDNPRHAAEMEAIERARVLLSEYTAEQPLVQIEAYFNAASEPETWTRMKGKYDLSASQLKHILLISGDGSTLRQGLIPNDLATFSRVTDVALETPQIVEFRGQQALTDAIRRLIERHRRVVYFTQDKQELSLLPARAGATPGPGSLNEVRTELRTAGYEAKPLSLSLVREIPADCEVLVLASPFQPYLEQELQTIDRFLQRGGSLFVALGPGRTGIERLLDGWGAAVKEGVIHSLQVAAQGRAERRQIVIRRFQSQHPATSAFVNNPFLLRMTGARALSPKGAERQLRAIPLLETYSTGGETHQLTREGENPTVLETRDFPVALAIEQEPPTANAPTNFQRLETRIVVVGASDFLMDKNFPQNSHRDFLLNCLAWLVGEEERASVGGDSWTTRTLDMNASFRRYLKFVPTLVFPGIFLCLGLFVYYLRRV